MQRWAVSLVLAVLAAAAAQAASFDAREVSAEAKWVVHADVAALKDTQIGSYFGKMEEGDVGNKIAAFSAVFGFDPRRDVTGLTLYGKSKAPEQGVAVVSGTFNQTQLVTLLKANDTYQAETYGPYTIHSWIDPNKAAEGRQFGAFHATGKTVISHGADMLKEALDVLDAKRPTLDAQKVFGAALPVKSPFFMAGADMKEAADLKPEAQVLRQAQSGQMALAESRGEANLAITLTAADLSAASNIQSVAQGMLAMAQLGQQSNPELARLAQSAQVTREGTEVRLNLSYPAKDIITMIEEGKARHPHGGAGAPPPAGP